MKAMSFEHARPEAGENRRVRYAAWGQVVVPMLARPAVAGTAVGIPVRRFRFDLDLSGKNKVVAFAHEETNT